MLTALQEPTKTKSELKTYPNPVLTTCYSLEQNTRKKRLPRVILYHWFVGLFRPKEECLWGQIALGNMVVFLLGPIVSNAGSIRSHTFGGLK